MYSPVPQSKVVENLSRPPPGPGSRDLFRRSRPVRVPGLSGLESPRCLDARSPGPHVQQPRWQICESKCPNGSTPVPTLPETPDQQCSRTTGESSGVYMQSMAAHHEGLELGPRKLYLYYSQWCIMSRMRARLSSLWWRPLFRGWTSCFL